MMGAGLEGDACFLPTTVLCHACQLPTPALCQLPELGYSCACGQANLTSHATLPLGCCWTAHSSSSVAPIQPIQPLPSTRTPQAQGARAVADIGGSIITGIDGNPLAVLVKQMGLHMADIRSGGWHVHLWHVLVSCGATDSLPCLVR